MSSDSLMKYLSVIFLFIVLSGCFVVVAIEILNNQSPSPYISNVLGAGIGFAMTTAGVAHGVNVLQNTNTINPGNINTVQASEANNNEHTSS